MCQSIPFPLPLLRRRKKTYVCASRIWSLGRWGERKKDHQVHIVDVDLVGVQSECLPPTPLHHRNVVGRTRSYMPLEIWVAGGVEREGEGLDHRVHKVEVGLV